MKFLKTLLIILATFLVLSGLTFCNAKAPNSITGTSGSTGTTTTPQQSITYTKEFFYLPACNNMMLQSITPPDKNKMRTAKYLIKNSAKVQVLNDYAGILQKDGWTVGWTRLKDNTPYSISAQKGGHIVIIVPQQNNNDVELTVTSV